jgi:hypothetical protein
MSETRANLEALANADYLGDGLYVGHDGHQMWLWTERDGILHYVAIEPAIWLRLLQWVVRLNAGLMEHQTGQEGGE